MTGSPRTSLPGAPARAAVPAALYGQEEGGAGKRPGALSYQPALDGLRAVAVLGVLAFHGGVPFAGGGFLGVEAFFVLSGFLITSLLVAEWTADSSIQLGRFWLRRARRLLPALFVVVAVIGVHQALVGTSGAVPGLFGDGVATLLYVGNWHQVFTGSGYFVSTGVVSPLQHTWSLAIEEQFYLLWPLVLIAVLGWSGRRRSAAGDRFGPAGARRAIRPMLVVAVIGAIASAIEMAWLFHGGAGLNRVYYGTDTRAQSLLVGAALALVLARWGLPRSPTARSVAVGGGAIGLVGLLVAMWLAVGTGPWLYHGGFLLVDLAVAATILASVAVPRSPTGRLLVLGPLVALGKISYGVYLWHFPLFLWLDAARVGAAGWALFAVRVAATVGVATASYFLVEQPIRHRRAPAWVLGLATPVAGSAALVSLLVAGAVPVAAAPQNLSGLYGSSGAPTTSRPTPSGRAAARSATGTQRASYVIASAGNPKVVGVFHTPDPVRALIVGDSIALTLGLGLGVDEAKYGVEMFDQGIIGCGYAISGEIWHLDHFVHQAPSCDSWPQQFAADVARFSPDVVVSEMGYWDCANRLWNGTVVHVGEPSYDAYLQHQIDLFVRAVGSGGRPVVFLTVPQTSAAPQPNGSPQPEDDPARKLAFNSLLRDVARRHPGQVTVLNLDQWVSPGGRYAAVVDNVDYRWSDGIHFSIDGGRALQSDILPVLVRVGQAFRHQRLSTSASRALAGS